jgi:hypothetical protein
VQRCTTLLQLGELELAIVQGRETVKVAYDPDRPEATAVIVNRTGWKPRPSEISAIVTVILMACAVWTFVGNGSIPPRWYGPFSMLALVSLIVVVFLRGLVGHVRQGVRRARLVKYGLAASLTFYGFGSFFAQFLAASGALTMIGPSTEWPVGPVDHVAQDANGTLIVPLVPQGRVQIYDRSGRFVRGWFVQQPVAIFGSSRRQTVTSRSTPLAAIRGWCTRTKVRSSVARRMTPTRSAGSKAVNCR